MKNWFESLPCASRAFCEPCRLNQPFRQALAEKGIVPHEDFPCPHGITLENLPLQAAIVGKGRCLTCEEKRRIAEQKLSQS